MPLLNTSCKNIWKFTTCCLNWIKRTTKGFLSLNFNNFNILHTVWHICTAYYSRSTLCLFRLLWLQQLCPPLGAVKWKDAVYTVEMYCIAPPIKHVHSQEKPWPIWMSYRLWVYTDRVTNDSSRTFFIIHVNADWKIELQLIRPNWL